MSLLTVAMVLGLVPAHALDVGVGKVDITPNWFEGRPVPEGGEFTAFDPWYDSGTDLLFDFEEPGAMGPDGKPGKAGVDDDGDGVVDNCDRSSCKEYMADGGDDVYDPNGDNFHLFKNFFGTENNFRFEKIFLGGFGPYFQPFFDVRWAAALHDRIWSRSLAIQGTNGTPVILVSTDLPGLVWKHINPIRRRVEAELGIPRENIIITSTHNHAAPDAAGYWTTLLPGTNRKYIKFMKERVYQSIVNSVETMRPAAMRTITTDHIACWDQVTREVKRLPDCRMAMIRDMIYDNPDKYDQFVMQADLRDPVVRNPEIVASQFVDQATGATIGVFANWHSHPDTLSGSNQNVSSDYPYYLRKYVERELGGVTVYFTGTLGSQIGFTSAVAPKWTEDMEPVFDGTDIHGNPVPQWEWGGRPDVIRGVGFEIGKEIVNALRAEPDWDISAEVKVKTEPVDTEVTNFLHLVGTGSVWFSRVEKEDRLRRYGPHCNRGFGCIRSDISLVEIGNLAILTSPGETDPAYWFGREASSWDYGERGGYTEYPAMEGVKQYMPEGKHHAFLGQANSYLSYLVPEHDNHGQLGFGHANHYEEFPATARTFGDDVGNKWMQMLGSDHRYSDRGIYPIIEQGRVVEVPHKTGRPRNLRLPNLRADQILEGLGRHQH